MKRFLLISGLAFLFMHVVAQHDSMIPKSQFDEQKKEIRQEANEIKNFLNPIKTEYILDSIVFYQYTSEYDSALYGKTEYIYIGTEEQHRIKYFWNELLEKWDNFQKTVYIFDENENLLEYWRINWDESSNAWLNDKKYVFEYNSAGLETLLLYYIWDETLGDWANSIKEEYTYDMNGNMTFYYSWMWDESLNDWLGEYFQEMTYTGTGKLFERIFYCWDLNLNDWLQSSKSDFGYDANDFLVLSKDYNWDEFSNIWVNNYKSEFTNNGSGNPDLIMSYHSWDNGLTWINIYKTEKTYNAADQEVLSIMYYWEENLSDWVFSEKDEFDWDNLGNRILEKRYHWENNDWQIWRMSVQSYNEFGTVLSTEVYAFNFELGLLIGDYRYNYNVNDDGKYILVYEYLWELTTSEWILDSKGFYHYTTFSNIEFLSDTRFEIYPNPVSNELTLKLKNPEPLTYSIFSLNGSLLLDGSTNQQIKNINVGSLPIGVYLISIDNGTEIISRRFVKE